MMSPADDPPYAHVPGQNERHPEGAFDAIRDTVQSGLSEAALSDSAAFQTGLRYLRDGFYWEAHEVLEPVWMACPPNALSRSVVQGLIQLANAKLKQKMNKPKAALRLLDIAAGHLNGVADVMGVNVGGVLRDIDSLRHEANSAL